MNTLRLSFFATVLLCGLSPAFGVGPGGGGSCGRCEIPYPNEVYLVDGYGTPSDASSKCYDRMLDMDLGWDIGGYVIKWLGGEGPADGGSKSYTCYACVNNGTGDGPGHTQPPYDFDQAGRVALEAYPGEISGVELFIVEDEMYGVGSSYEVTIVNTEQKRSAIVRIDPFTGHAKVVDEAAVFNN